MSRAGGLEVVGEATNGALAVSLAKELSPDVILMDINMPVLNGLEATRKLRREAPHVKVLVLTVHDNKEYVLQIAQAGARGYILKDAPPDELVQAIRAVHQGEVFFSSRVAKHVLSDYLAKVGNAPEAKTPRLSNRECEVLALIAEGCTNKEISIRLKVSVRTIETHRERVMGKLNIHNVAGLTRYAIANKIGPSA